MAVKSGSAKTSDGTRGMVNAGEKDRLITELKDRIAILENELRLTQEGKTPRDVPGCRQAEEALRVSKERLEFSLNSADIGAWDLNLIDHTAWRSLRHDQIFGYGDQLPEWTYEMFIDHVLPEDREYVNNGFQKALGKHGDWDFECRIRRVDGAVRWIWAHGRARYDEHGQPVRMFGINIDITEHKQVEKDLRRLRDELEQSVRERTLELQRSNDVLTAQIKERMRMAEELDGAKQQAELYLDLMGHDINNMHQIALGYLELIRDTQQNADQSELLDKCIEVLQRSTRLIQNVRKLQKHKEGVFKIHDVDVCEMLRDVQREFGAVPGKEISLNLHGCKRCRVRANELLHDVFTNLVSNAIKHTGDRSDIGIGLDFINDDSHRYCRVSVEDNGRGIPDDFKARIFNRMLKGTDKAKGMGIGLYLVKSLVDSYDGRVWVEDRVPGEYCKGARFVVLLPVVD